MAAPSPTPAATWSAPSTSGTTTTTYVGGGAMEVIQRPGGSVVETKHYIGDFAVVTTSAAATATHYLHRDHLGSVDTITDAAGAIVQRMSFDASMRSMAPP
jgi:uncharacterized protein RhaS with RHS repeats